MSDEENRARRGARIPSTQEYIDAFRRFEEENKIKDDHRKMLKALLNAPDRTLTQSQIANAAGHESYRAANVILGPLASKFCDYLGFEPSDDKTEVFATRADPNLHPNDGSWRWKMRPEVAECLLAIKL